MSSKYIQIIILAAVFGLQFFFEHIFPQRKEINDWKNERFNIGIGVLNIILTVLPSFFLVQLIHHTTEQNWGLFNHFRLSSGLNVLIVIVILDFFIYGWHVLNHRIPFFWRFHSFHHKDTKMNSTTALRFHFVELLLSYPVKAMIILCFGIQFIPLLIYELLFFTSVVFHHSNIFISEKMDSLYSKLFSSPMMHRIHHSNKTHETNSNYGALFSFWDNIFHTRIKKAEGPIRFGISEDDPLKTFKN